MLSRREFQQVLAAAALAGIAPGARAADAGVPPRQGNVSLLHITDTHAQLHPLHYREPSTNLGAGAAAGQLPHLTGGALLRRYGLAPGSRAAHAFADLDFERLARRYGPVGGYAHLATLVKRLKASRPGALLLDGGDAWQGSATALWTRGADMAEITKALGVDVMTGHWEFTYGMARVKELAAGLSFVAQNVRTADFDDPVFDAWTMKSVNGVEVAVIGQAFPYTPIANPRRFVADWTFGIQEARLQQVIDEARARGARVVVLLSHNGMDVDLKLAGRVRGLDAILGGHTHDGVPLAIPVRHDGGSTLVTNAGSHGKFVGVLDLDVQGRRIAGWRYRLLPVFARQWPADREMAALITKWRAPHEERLRETLAVSDGLLYRRGNFNGSWDQLICDALLEQQQAQIAFSPGFRWGGTLLPGAAITRERLMDQLATTYSYATVGEMTGEQIKTVLEDVADNLFNPDPYYQQGGDMVRTGGLSYAIEPGAAMGRRIQDLRLRGEPLEAGKAYRVAGWAPVSDESAGAGLPWVWDVVEPWLKRQGHVAPRRPNLPRLIG